MMTGVVIADAPVQISSCQFIIQIAFHPPIIQWFRKNESHPSALTERTLLVHNAEKKCFIDSRPPKEGNLNLENILPDVSALKNEINKKKSKRNSKMVLLFSGRSPVENFSGSFVETINNGTLKNSAGTQQIDKPKDNQKIFFTKSLARAVPRITHSQDKKVGKLVIIAVEEEFAEKHKEPDKLFPGQIQYTFSASEANILDKSIILVLEGSSFKIDKLAELIGIIQPDEEIKDKKSNNVFGIKKRKSNLDIHMQKHINKLEHPNPFVRAQGAKKLEKGKRSNDTVAQLINLFNDTWKEVRYYALRSLGRIADRQHIEPLVYRALRDESKYIRYHALSLVEHFEINNPNIIFLLLDFTGDPNSDIRYKSIRILGDFAASINNQQEVINLLQSIVRNDKSIKIRCLAFNVLGYFQQKDRDSSIIELLIHNLSSPCVQTRVEAGSCLIELGSAAKPAVAALMRGLKDVSDNVYICCERSLSNIFFQIKYALPILKKILKNENGDVRMGACSYLQMIGKQAEETIPLLMGALEDEFHVVKESALYAIKTIGIDKKYLSNFLYLYENSDFSRSVIVSIVGTIENISCVMPLMISWLESNIFEVRSTAIGILGAKRFYPTNVDLLIHQLEKEDDIDLCRKIVENLSKLPHSLENICDIIAYNKNDEEIDSRLLLMLASMDKSDRQIETITNFQKNESVNVRWCAEVVLKNIQKEVVTDELE